MKQSLNFGWSQNSTSPYKTRLVRIATGVCSATTRRPVLAPCNVEGDPFGIGVVNTHARLAPRFDPIGNGDWEACTPE